MRSWAELPEAIEDLNFFWGENGLNFDEERVEEVVPEVSEDVLSRGEGNNADEDSRQAVKQEEPGEVCFGGLFDGRSLRKFPGLLLGDEVDGDVHQEDDRCDYGADLRGF